MKKPLLMGSGGQRNPRGRCARRHRPPQAAPRDRPAWSAPTTRPWPGPSRRWPFRGRGDIAITAGFGLYLAARAAERSGAAKKPERLREAADRLIATRPTGFHLAALVNKLMGRIEEAGDAKPASEVILASLRRALESQRRISEDTGRHGARRCLPRATGS